MKRLLTVLIILVGALMILTSNSRLERDAKALAEVIAERMTCNLTPAYRGFDGVAGKYDFDQDEQRNFKLGTSKNTDFGVDQGHLGLLRARFASILTR